MKGERGKHERSVRRGGKLEEIKDERTRTEDRKIRMERKIKDKEGKKKLEDCNDGESVQHSERNIQQEHEGLVRN